MPRASVTVASTVWRMAAVSRVSNGLLVLFAVVKLDTDGGTRGIVGGAGDAVPGGHAIGLSKLPLCRPRLLALARTGVVPNTE